MAELVTTNPQAYEALACDLARSPERLAALKKKLVDNRLTTPLFDSKRFTRDFEAACTAMFDRHQRGLAPDDIHVPGGLAKFS
jgi:predicted O-linked N-acetylglucosamine transferase (SPINDLY family)